MAVTILPRETTIAETLGQGLGSGLSSGIQQLVNSRIQQVQQREAFSQKSKALQGFGFSPQEAYALASLPEKIMGPLILSYLEKGGGASVEPEQIDTGLGALEGLQENKVQAPQLSARDQLNLLSQPALQNLGLINQQEQLSPEAQQQLGKSINPSIQNQQENEAPESDRSKARRAEHLAKRPSIREVLSRPSKAEQAKAQVAADKESKPVYDEINREYKSAVNNEKRLNRIEQLTQRGWLGVPVVNSLLKSLSKGIFGFGIDLTSLMTADAQELDKLSNDFIRDAKEIFGGSRLTDADLSAFLKTVPTLAQSNNGRLRIVHNLRAFNEAAKVKKQALDRILEANGGRRPGNLEYLVEKVAGPQLDTLAKQFSSGGAPQIQSNALGGLGQALGLSY